MCDSSIFIYKHEAHIANLLLHVDKIVLTEISSPLLTSIVSTLGCKFSMSHLGDLHYLVGIFGSTNDVGLYLSQQKYVLDILDRASMLNCKPARTPSDLSSKLDGSGSRVVHSTMYHGIVGAPQYLTFTRPYITYVFQ